MNKRPTPINWKKIVVCKCCHKSIQLASIKRHETRGCLPWNSFNKAYLLRQEREKD